jgi:GH25 family lysozyme M1 (1,4-beta-N-acetylmuramidase)
VSYVDISSHQAAAGTIDLRAYRDAGHTDLMLKATEGTGYAWSGMGGLALQWHNFGPQYRVGYYHWLYATLSAASQHDFFWRQVSPVWRSGDWTMTDFEDTEPTRWRSVSATLPVLEEFVGRCWTHGYHDIYTGNWFLANLPRCRTYLTTQNVVMSDYTNDPPANPYGLSYDAHQFTSSATVAGMPGRVDYNRWLGEQAAGGGTPLTPGTTTPVQPEDDVMTDAQYADIKEQLTRIETHVAIDLSSDQATQSAVGAIRGPIQWMYAQMQNPSVLAAAIAARLPAASSASAPDVEAALRAVFADAGVK